MGNFKVKCVDTNGARYYTKGNVYDITDGTIISDDGCSLFTGKINSFEDLEGYSIAKWELVKEEKENNSMYIISEDLKKYSIAKIISKEEEEDIVNQPSHYLSSSLECIQAMEMAFGIEVVYNFCICNAWKYLWRYKSKNGKQDVAKARWYIDKAKSYNHYEVQHINIENVLIEIEKEVE